jgi:hypothetical protein
MQYSQSRVSRERFVSTRRAFAAALFASCVVFLGTTSAFAGGKSDGASCHVAKSCASKLCVRVKPADKFGVCCTPQSCASLGAQCGPIDNGCGIPEDCGTCDPGSDCLDNQCVGGPTTTTTSTTTTTTSTTTTSTSTTSTSTTTSTTLTTTTTTLPPGTTTTTSTTTTTVPILWTCDVGYYADGICDCGCGVVDPDCADATVGSCEYCNDVGSCGLGACPSNIYPTDNSRCS